MCIRDSDTAYDRVMKEVCAGLLVIGTQGCTYDNLLMWKGSEQGKIVYIDWNLEPEYGPFLTGMSFLDWYESYFQEIIAGNSVTSYGYRSLKSEEELAALYPAVETSEERRQILMGFFRFNRVEPGTVEFLAGLRDPEPVSYTHLFRRRAPSARSMPGTQYFHSLFIVGHDLHVTALHSKNQK